MKVKRMGITKVLRRIWLFSANKIKGSESISKKQLSSSLGQKIDTIYFTQGGVAFMTAHFKRKVLVHTDKRVSLMNEVINSIRLIKMYAWEDSFNEKIQSIRLDEMRALQKTAFLQSISFSITPCITVVAAVVTIIALT